LKLLLVLGVHKLLNKVGGARAQAAPPRTSPDYYPV
jgi:hypothetical protein